jgi:hypothetical protein
VTSPDLTSTVPLPTGAWAEFSLTASTVRDAARAALTHYGRYQRLFMAMHRVPITGPAIQVGALVCDRADLLGPSTGSAWDVRRLTMAAADLNAPWTGHIYVYLGNPSAVNQVDVFDGPDTHLWPKGGLLLQGHDRLVFMAGPDFAGGVAIPGGEAIQLIDELVPEYLS